jgi:hypothetical protein
MKQQAKAMLFRILQYLYPYTFILSGMYIWSTLSIERAARRSIPPNYINAIWNFYVPFAAFSIMLIGVGCTKLLKGRYSMLESILTTMNWISFIVFMLLLSIPIAP